MSNPEYKEFKVSASSMKPRRGGTRKSKKQEGGADLLNQSAPSISQPPAWSNAATAAATAALKQLGPAAIQRGGDNGATVQLSASRAPGSSANVVPVVSGASPGGPGPFGGGFHLQPPKRKTRIALKGPMQLHNKVKHMSRKAPRKIHIRSRGVTSRLLKAKVAAKQAATAPIGEIKGKLEASKIIKKGSKAPEAMLRNMYADLLITKKGL
jgi:hypothetical protein